MHIERERLVAFIKNEIEDTNELMEILGHIGECDYCADLLANIESDTQNDEFHAAAPKYLKEQIIERSNKLDIKAEIIVKRTSKNMQLLIYSLKTTVAVVGALILLFSVSKIDTRIDMDYSIPPKEEIEREYNKHKQFMDNNEISISEKLSEKSNKISNTIYEISNIILNGGSKQ